MVAVSRSATTDGAVYGTYTTGLSHVPGAKGHTKVACVLVKCPDDNSGSTQNTTKGPVQTFVDIGILPGKKSTCQFRLVNLLLMKQKLTIHLYRINLIYKYERSYTY